MNSLLEEWRAVKGCEGQYEVSNHGRIRSLDRAVICLSRWGLPRAMKVRGRIVKDWIGSTGYRCVRLYGLGGGEHFRIHRIVASAFIGDPGEKQVNHIDGDKLNNAASNLEYVTPKENIAHAMDAGLMPRVGQSNPAARYTAEQIRHAHSLVLGGSTYADAAAATGVGFAILVNVCHGKNWKSLGLPVIRRMPIRANLKPGE